MHKIPHSTVKTIHARYVLETGPQITEKYLKIIIKQLRATGHMCQRDTTQYRLVLTY